MRQSGETVPAAAELLEHPAWTRRLARTLIGDDAADDLVQDTWLAAVRHPPDASRPLRPWLGTIIRHQAVNRSLEVHKILVDLVAELPEPYRRTVLLAYFEELTSAEIGSRQNIPPGTVRGRLKAALELLRQALDQRFGGRAAWLAPVSELTRPPPGPGKSPAHAGPSRVRAAPAGGVGGANGLLTLAGAVVVVAAAATIWSVARAPSRRATPVSEVASTAGDDGALVGRRLAAGHDEPNEGARAALFSEEVLGVVTVDPANAWLVGGGRASGNGVSGVIIRVVGGLAPQHDPSAADVVVKLEGTGLRPRVQFARSGQKLLVENGDDAARDVRVVRGPIELFKRSIPGDGSASAVTVPSGVDVLRVERVDRVNGSAFVVPTENAFHAVSDAEGHFSIRGLPNGRYTLEAWDADLGTRTSEIVVPKNMLVRFSFGGTTLASGGRGPCKIALKGESLVARSCAQGGRDAAVKVMEDLVMFSKAHGEKYACDGCHKDTEGYELTTNARTDLDALLASIGRARARR
jgi:DNA-directed RNA polymerase specialized sigma24 family protein